MPGQAQGRARVRGQVLERAQASAWGWARVPGRALAWGSVPVPVPGRALAWGSVPVPEQEMALA